jgi:hypothetical protein
LLKQKQLDKKNKIKIRRSVINKQKIIMQNLADSSPNDENIPHSLENRSRFPLKHPQSQPLYPIDETEEFHDPFSDLSLFLSKKIKQEVEKHGSSKQWSSKIQTDLLAKILPEFKIKFPKYRLGVASIKKVWEKVSYYYGKVHSHQEAIDACGKLNVEFMIKENLRGYPSKTPANLPYYNIANQLAVKISECIATLDGTKPRLDHLTKSIWSVQKHLLPHLPAQTSKNIYDDYDGVDKLIIKIVLEKIAKTPLASQKMLQELVCSELKHLQIFTQTISSETLYQNLATLLALHFYPKLSIHEHFNQEEKQALHTFIESQIIFSKPTKALETAAHRIETTQRILILYLLTSSLPKDISLTKVKEAIKLVYSNLTNNKPFTHPHISQSVFAFIRAEMHFLKRKEEFSSYQKIESRIISTFLMSQKLPAWKEDCLDDLEVVIWKIFHLKSSFLTLENTSLLKEELSNCLLDYPQYGFKNRIYHVIESFKKTKTLLCRNSEEESHAVWEEIEHKIYTWTIQNTMLCRWIHFDQNTPLFNILTPYWQENDVEINASIEASVDVFLRKYPAVIFDVKHLKNRATILHYYFWYHHLSEPQDSSLDCFIRWHWQDIQVSYPRKSREESLLILETRCQSLLPATPISRKQLENLT